MPPLILLALISVLPLVLAVVLRVKPLYLFVAIVTGYFWATFLGEPAELTLRSMLKLSNPEVIAGVGLLLIPVILTFMIMGKTLSAAALPFQFGLLLANSLLLVTLLLPLLPAGTQESIYQTQAGSTFRQAHDVAIAAIAGLHLLVMFFMRPKTHHGRGKHRK